MKAETISFAEAVEYLKQRGLLESISPEVLRLLWEKTEGDRHSFEMLAEMIFQPNAMQEVLLVIAWSNRDVGSGLLLHLESQRLLSLNPMEIYKNLDILTTNHSLSFIKIMPQRRYLMHDELRRLINEYIWPLRDPLHQFRDRLDEAIQVYYDQICPEI